MHTAKSRPRSSIVLRRPKGFPRRRSKTHRECGRGPALEPVEGPPHAKTWRMLDRATTSPGVLEWASPLALFVKEPFNKRMPETSLHRAGGRRFLSPCVDA